MQDQASARDRILISAPRSGGGTWLWALAVFALALIPRLVRLSARPFWLDEAFTFQRASLSPAGLMLDSFQNHHTPSFFLMLSPLSHLGHPEFWLRLPSALFGAAAVALIFVIASRILGRGAGGMAALIFGMSPMALAYSQEARSYTMDMCLILVALYGAVLLARAPEAAAGRFLARPGRAGWLIFILGSAAAIDVLADALLWLLAADLTFCLYFLWQEQRTRLLGNLALANLVIAILCAPLYALMFHYQIMVPGSAMGWIPQLTLSRLWYSLGSIYFMHMADWVTFHLIRPRVPQVLIWAIDGGLILALGAAMVRLRRQPGVLLILGMAALLPPVLFCVVSLWKPVLLPRYLLWSDAPFAILAGIGLASVLNRCAPLVCYPAMALVAGALFANMMTYYEVETKPRWDIAADMLAQEVAPSDVIYLNDQYAGTMLDLYLPADRLQDFQHRYVKDLGDAAKLQAQGHRVWAIIGNAGQLPNNPDLPEFLKAARALGQSALLQMAGRHIVLLLYGAKGAQPGDP